MRLTETMEASRGGNRRLVWILLAAGLTLILLWLGLKAWNTYRAASSLLAIQDRARVLQAEGLSQVSADEAEELVLQLRQDIRTLDREWGGLAALGPSFDWLPGKLGPLAAATPHLLEMADGGSEAAVYAVRGLKPALVLLQNPDPGESSRVPELVRVLHEAESDLALAGAAMERATSARAAIENTDQLPWRVQQLLEQLDPWLPVGEKGMRLAQVLPEFLGYDGLKRYLLVAQNEDELRGTGGFISGAGVLELQNGEIVYLRFEDANFVDAWSDSESGSGLLVKPYDFPPQPLYDFMGLELFLFRDANYWPDFPTSAEKAMELYRYGQDADEMDGAIAIDQQFLSLLVEATGAIALPEENQTINKDNVIQSLQSGWTLDEGVRERKSFLSTFSTAIMGQLENNLESINPLTLARNMVAGLETKHLQLYSTDPEVAQTLAEIGWDGALVPPVNADALAVIDMNVGYNKANLHIERDIVYDAVLAEDGSARANLKVIHTHTGQKKDEPCVQGTIAEYESGAPYLALADKCYWNYLRVYVPEGSELIEGPAHVVPGETWFRGFDWDRDTDLLEEVPGFITFGNFMLVPRGEKVESHYVYQLPVVVAALQDGSKAYRLTLYKQGGTGAQRVQVSLQLPPGANLQEATPAPTSREGNTLHFIFDLDRNETVTVQYR